MQTEQRSGAAALASVETRYLQGVIVRHYGQIEMAATVVWARTVGQGVRKCEAQEKGGVGHRWGEETTWGGGGGGQN